MDEMGAMELNGPFVNQHSDILENVGVLCYGMRMAKSLKTGKQMERHLKGVANHRRIDILMLLKKSDELTLDEIASRLDCNFKTISEHTRRLAHAGLINKSYKGRSVIHTLSPYGKIFSNFLETFRHS